MTRASARSTPRGRGRAGVWREHHAWSLAASMQRLAAHPAGTVLTVLVMGLALAIPLAFWLLLGNVQQLTGALGRTQAVNVFMTTQADGDAAHALADTVRQRSDTQHVSVKTPAAGRDELTTMQGFSKAFDSLDTNPLPYVLVVEPAAGAGPVAIHALRDALSGMSGVAQVQDDGTWRQRLESLLDAGRRLGLALAVLLALAAILVVGNSVRLDIQDRAEQLRVFRLMGAGSGFARRPYLYAGLWYGLASGFLAVTIVLLLQAIMAAPMQQLARSYAGQLTLQGLSWWQVLLVPAAAAALGWAGAWLVSAHWLRRSA